VPRIVDKDTKRKEIVQASLGVFAQKGFKDTIMADIAGAAGIGKGTIYEYFPNKQAIFHNVFQLIQNELDREISRSISTSPDHLKKLKAFIIGYCRFYENLPEAMLIYIDYWIETMKREMKMPHHNLNNQYRQIISILEQGNAGGGFRPLETRLRATIIFSAIGGLVFQWITMGRDFPLIDAANELAETLLKWIETTDRQGMSADLRDNTFRRTRHRAQTIDSARDRKPVERGPR
jgi:AcrR family transcriptional regulator